MERLKDKVAVVVGGAGGLGSAFSLGLAREGARVAVADIDEAPTRRLAGELSQAGPECMGVRVDVAEPASAEAMAREVVERFGRIDILVNSAAIYVTLTRKDFLEIEPAEWDLVINVNLTGAANCARAVLPSMKEHGSGSIINIGSVNSVLAPAGRAHYSAGKAALENLTKTLAREVGPHGIRVNCISPGLVRTGRAPNVSEERYRSTAEERALKQELLPEDIVGPLVFLCSDDARMVTGHTLVVDGGQIFV